MILGLDLAETLQRSVTHNCRKANDRVSKKIPRLFHTNEIKQMQKFVNTDSDFVYFLVHGNEIVWVVESVSNMITIRYAANVQLDARFTL